MTFRARRRLVAPNSTMLLLELQLEAAIRRETEVAKQLLAEGKQRQALLAIKKRKMSVRRGVAQYCLSGLRAAEVSSNRSTEIV